MAGSWQSPSHTPDSSRAAELRCIGVAFSRFGLLAPSAAGCAIKNGVQRTVHKVEVAMRSVFALGHMKCLLHGVAQLMHTVKDAMAVLSH